MANKNKLGFPAKYAKHLDPGWMEDVDSMGEDDLKKIIVDSEGVIEQQEKLMEDDQKLKEIKELFKDLRGAYTEAIQHQKAKIKYALFSLEKAGKM